MPHRAQFGEKMCSMTAVQLYLGCGLHKNTIFIDKSSSYLKVLLDIACCPVMYFHR